MPRSVVAFLLVLMSAPGGRAAPQVEYNVDLFCGWDGYYRPLEWTPVEIGITTNLTEPSEGVFIIGAQQDGLNTLNIMHNIVLTPNQRLDLPLAAKLDFRIGRCILTIEDKRGRTQWQEAVDLWDFSTGNQLLKVVQDRDLLVGVMGQPQFGLRRLGEDTTCMSPRGAGTVYVGTKTPEMMPWDWTGFASLDVLVLYDPDWTLLRPQQVKAVCDWVSNGGILLLVLGRHPLPKDSPLADLLPVSIGELRTCEIPSDILGQWGLDSGRPQTVPAWPLSARPGASLWQKTDVPGVGCLFGAGYAGFGRVAVLGFDPSGLSQEQARRTAEFWTSRIAACLDVQPSAPIVVPAPDGTRIGGGCRRTILLKSQTPGNAGPRQLSQNQFSIGIAQDASNRVMEYLYQLRQMRPVSIWWVILTLSALAILLGPVDYLVLKRFDKLPYTWLTSTGWIVLFTVGAYYGVQYLRGGTMQLRAISVLDSVADSNCAWGTYYTGVFAPRSDNYRLDGLKETQWWAGMAPTQEITWATRRESAMRQIYCVQQDGANLPTSLPINIWTVQSLLGESPLDRAPFVAKVKRDGNAVEVAIDNRSTGRITAGVVLWANGCVDLGAVDARASRTFTATSRPFEAWGDGIRPDGQPTPIPTTLVGMSTPQYPGRFLAAGRDAFLAQGCLNRTLAMHERLQRGAALVCVVYEDAPTPFTVRGHSPEVTHVQYARQLIPDVNDAMRGQHP